MKKLPLTPWWLVLIAAFFCFVCGSAYARWGLPHWIVSFAMLGSAVLGMLALHLWNESPTLRASNYVYGRCNGRLARRHKLSGEVEFILWKKGDRQGDHVYTDNFWCRFDPSWWDQFVPARPQDVGDAASSESGQA